MNAFKPTFLYIKQHNVTGLKYFGKTVKSNPTAYKGSGRRWCQHLVEFGNDVTTVWYCLYYDKQELRDFALSLSKQYNIIKDESWANLTNENGVSSGGNGGAMKGRKNPKASQKQKGVPKPNSSKGKKRKPLSEEHRHNLSKSCKGVKKKVTHARSEECKKRQSEMMSGRTQRKVACPHCGLLGGRSSMTRWHFDNCKQAAAHK